MNGKSRCYDSALNADCGRCSSEKACDRTENDLPTCPPVVSVVVEDAVVESKLTRVLAFEPRQRIIGLIRCVGATLGISTQAPECRPSRDSDIREIIHGSIDTETRRRETLQRGLGEELQVDTVSSRVEFARKIWREYMRIPERQ